MLNKAPYTPLNDRPPGGSYILHSIRTRRAAAAPLFIYLKAFFTSFLPANNKMRERIKQHSAVVCVCVCAVAREQRFVLNVFA